MPNCIWPAARVCHQRSDAAERTRIALVCYGGVSLAVYMHGVTKEIWKLARASRGLSRRSSANVEGVEAVYHQLLERSSEERALRLRVLPDILAGASAGGINAVFLAQAIHSGHSLEPLTELWLDNADVDATARSRGTAVVALREVYMGPIVLVSDSGPGNAVSESVAPETRTEVRRKISQLHARALVRAAFLRFRLRRLIHRCLLAMADAAGGGSAIAAAPSARPAGHGNRFPRLPRDAASEQPADWSEERASHADRFRRAHSIRRRA